MIEADEKAISKSRYREAYNRILARVHHEDTLIENRFSWLLTSQTIFFTAFGVITGLLTNSSDGKIIEFDWVKAVQSQDGNVFFVLYNIRVFALIICIVNYSSLLAALFAIYAYCRKLIQDFPECYDFTMDNILGMRSTHVLGQMSAFLLPLGFVAIWLITLVGPDIAKPIVAVLLVSLVGLWIVKFPRRPGSGQYNRARQRTRLR